MTLPPYGPDRGIDALPPWAVVLLIALASALFGCGAYAIAWGLR